jgi:hypothetical protein
VRDRSGVIAPLGPILLGLLVSAACADKAPPALFPHPQPPALARPIEPAPCQPKAPGDPKNLADASLPACEDEPAREP